MSFLLECDLLLCFRRSWRSLCRWLFLLLGGLDVELAELLEVDFCW